jgi:ABC-2 type transport system ATP-binding protein
MGTPVVEIHEVSKRFKLYADKPRSLKERVISIGRQQHEEFYALRDVSLDVLDGETVGLLGHNGSGKSTLLKCIAGTLRPSEGSIRTRGRLAALLELGAGFHPDLTGRENIYLNGSILGLSARDVDRVFDDIVAFSELEPFIDTQVKHYSSGMYARLGFAVAVNVDPEILLVDEVLAVGDESFQRKCLDHIKRLQADGRSIVLVTHAADLVRQICDKAAVLDQGNLLLVGDPGDAVRTYREALARRGVKLAGVARELTGTIRFTDVQVELPDDGRDWLAPGEALVVRVGYEALQPSDDAVFALELHDQDGNRLLGTNTDILDVELGRVEGRGEVAFRFPSVPLLDGTYAVSLGIHTLDSTVEYDHRDQLDRFSVVSGSRTQGRVHFDLQVEHASR